MRPLTIWVVVGKHRSRKDRVQNGVSKLSMVSVVVDLLSEEHGCRIRGENDLWTELTNQAHKGATKLIGIPYLSIIKPQRKKLRNSKKRTGLSHLRSSPLGQDIGRQVGVNGAFLPTSPND
jgi:hypothetical protein